MYSWIIVGGRFDDSGGKPSGYVKKLYSCFSDYALKGECLNGGEYETLVTLMSGIHLYDVIIWLPDVPNDKEKLVRDIKKKNPKAILVTSKNNLENKYPFMELIARALQNKANLSLEFTRNSENKINVTLFDPLGNVWINSDSIPLVALSIAKRVSELKKFTRIGCVHSDDTILPQPPKINPEFFEIVKNYAKIFHECIHPVNTTRMLGNCSFRCENGFPSFRDGEIIWVSKRNIDKREICPESFVPTQLVPRGAKTHVAYSGEYKPSVDTPVQLLLYAHYRKIRYMIHSHTYIKDAPMTQSKIPCGAIEEFFEIVLTNTDHGTEYMEVNLFGHGSIVLTSSIDRLKNIEYIQRPLPERFYYV